MTNIIFKNTLTYAGGKDVLSPLITALFDQDEVSQEYMEDLMEKMGFKQTRALTPEQKFSIMIGAYELEKITEDQDLPEAEVGKGANKGYEIEQFGKKIGISKLFKKWIESAQTLEGADTSVKTEWANLAQNIRNLQRGKVKSKNISMTEVLTKGRLNNQPNGAGSATPYGSALFSASHSISDGTDSFSNLLTAPNGVLNLANLQDALDAHKARLRLQNGDRVMSPSKYKLIVSRENAVNARKLLNTPGNMVSMFSGAGNNASQVNQFIFDGNVVEIVENPFLGYKKRDGSTVGTPNQWFVCNSEAASMASALRFITLYDAEVRVFENHDNGKTYVGIDMGYAVDHYGLESFIVGSEGTVA